MNDGQTIQVFHGFNSGHDQRKKSTSPKNSCVRTLSPGSWEFACEHWAKKKANSVHHLRPQTRIELPARIVFHVMLTSVDSCRCDSHCLARLFKICLPHPSTTASSMFCRFAKFLPKGKTWGRTRQRPTMTDFHRKVNKFWQRFAKCDPCHSYDTAALPSDWLTAMIVPVHKKSSEENPANYLPR